MRDWIKGIPAAMELRLSCRVALLALVVVATWGAVAGCERTDPAQPAGTVETQEVSLPPTPVIETPTPVATATPVKPTPTRPDSTATPAPRGQREAPSEWQLETRSNPEVAALYPLADLYTADEIAQVMGLARDSWWFPDSRFYQGISARYGLADIDEALIRLLYDPRIEPGMTIEDLERMGL